MVIIGFFVAMFGAMPVVTMTLIRLSTNPAAFLPELGGYAFGAVLSVILEFAKLFGVHEGYAVPITIIAAALWTAAIMVTGYWPVAGDWIVAVITVVITLSSVILGSKATYAAAIKPISKKRWNVDKS